MAIAGLLVRSKRHNERPEIRALRGSKAGSFQILVQTYWAARTLATMSPALGRLISKSSHPIPYVRSDARTAIW
jgi:hypothetical protein